LPQILSGRRVILLYIFNMNPVERKLKELLL